MRNTQKFLNDEWEEKKKIRPASNNLPKRICDTDESSNKVQESGFDCGVFACVLMYFSDMS